MSKKKMIGCEKCRQDDDTPYVISEQKYDAGWLGEVESVLELRNYPIILNKDYKYQDNDVAWIHYDLYSLRREDKYMDEPLIYENQEIKFCPFCGAELSKVREYIRSIATEDDEE